MKRVGFGILAVLGCLVLALIVYGYVSDYNIIRVLLVELAPEYSFQKIVKDYDTTETEHIVWYYPKDVRPPEKDLIRMEQAYSDAAQFWGIDSVEKLSRKIRFVWLPGESRYDRSRIQKALGESIQGRAFPGSGIVYSIFSYTPHELNHVIAGQVNNTTTLLNEGFANYFNKVNWERNVHQVMVQAKREGAVIPLTDMLTHKDFRSQNSRIVYAEAAIFVKYLVEERDVGKFKKLYSEVSFSDDKRAVIAKIEEVYGESFSEFTTKWEDYLNLVIM